MPYWKPMCRMLEESGVKDWEVKNGGRHPHLIFQWRGKRIRYTIPSNPGDGRMVLNMVGSLRRLMRRTT